MKVRVAFRNARRSCSTPLEYALEQAGHELQRAPKGWKHGIVTHPKWPTIVLAKHPLAWIRSRVRWALPTPRFRFYNPWIQQGFEAMKKVICSRWEPGQRLLYSPLIDAYFRGYAYWFSELENYIYVRHEDLITNPDKETKRIAAFLGIKDFQLPDKKINPREGNKGPVGDFDPSFYLDMDWLDWYTLEELEWIVDYLESENIDSFIRQKLSYDYDVIQEKEARTQC